MFTRQGKLRPFHSSVLLACDSVVGREKMKPNEETKRFWLMMYAMDAFKKNILYCNYLMANNLSIEDTVYIPIVIAILTLYGKPWHNNQGIGKLDDSIVPHEHRILHDLMLRDRDKIHAHSDSDGVKSKSGCNANHVRLVRSERGHKWTVPTSFNFGDKELEEIILLCEKLNRKLDGETSKIEKTFASEIQRLLPGEYLLNLSKEDVSIFKIVDEVGLRSIVKRWDQIEGSI